MFLYVPLLLMGSCSPAGEQAAQEPAARATVTPPPPTPTSRSEPVAEADSPYRAVSLRGLRDELEACQPRGSCSRELLEFFGITWIMGYVVDEAGDVVLFGHSDPTLPALRVEDFVVALRNAWRRYTHREGNVILYAHPGCSIDPDPRVIRELQAAGQGVVQEDSGQSDALAEWHRICRKPQEVVVLGLPFDTHFAHVMVEADYQMKSQVDGTDPLETAGLSSLTDMTLATIRNDVENDRQISVPMSTMNRFWFYPGENLFEEDEAVVALTLSPVTLLSNQTYVNVQGEIADTSDRDPLAERFAESFTLLFPKVADSRPIYRQLEGLFRFVALANVIRFKLEDQAHAAVLDFFLDRFAVPVTEVDRQVPGRSAVAGFEHRKPTERGELILTLRLPSCGGVEAAVRVDRDSFRPSEARGLAGARTTILANRPAGAVSWNVASGGYLAEARRGQEVARLNDLNREVLLVEVVDTKTGYRLSTGPTFYEGNDFRELVRAVNAEVEAANARGRPATVGTVYFELWDFTPDQVESFASSCRIHQAAVSPEVRIRSLLRRSDADDSFFSPGVRRLAGETPPITEVTEGRLKGWYQADVPLLTQIRRGAAQVIVGIYGRTREVVAAVLAKIDAYFRRPTARAISPADLIQQIRRELKREHGYTDEELELEFEDQFGHRQIVDLGTPFSRRAA